MDRGVKVVLPYIVLLGTSSDSGKARVGFIVSKKVGGAVTRNQVKRRFREVYRTMQLLDSPLDVVVIARVGVDRCPYGDLQQFFVNGMRQLEAKLKRRLAANSGQSPDPTSTSMVPADVKNKD